VEDKKMLGENIKNARTEAGISQKDLADFLYVTPQAVSRWENGTAEPSVEMIKKISDVLDVSVDWLMDVTPAPKEEDSEGKKTAIASLTGALTQVETSPDIAVNPPAPEVTSKTPAPSSEEPAPVPTARVVGQCPLCHQDLLENQPTYNYQRACGSHQERRRQGRHWVTRNVTDYENIRICQSCHRRMVEKEELAAEQAEEHEAYAAQVEQSGKKSKALHWGWGIAITACAIDILVGILMIVNGTDYHPGMIALLLLPLVFYAFFAFAFVMAADNTFIPDFFMSTTLTGFVKMPGVIFSFSPDGLAFLIVAKVLLALLAISIAVAVFLFATALCMFFSLFAFPVSLSRLSN
jgi:transcriptional regulator with XRE-family HTH domain